MSNRVVYASSTKPCRRHEQMDISSKLDVHTDGNRNFTFSYASLSRLRRDIVEFHFNLFCRFINMYLESATVTSCARFFPLFWARYLSCGVSSIFLVINLCNKSRKLITILLYCRLWKELFYLFYCFNIIYPFSSHSGHLIIWHFAFNCLIPNTRVTSGLTLY